MYFLQPQPAFSPAFRHPRCRRSLRDAHRLADPFADIFDDAAMALALAQSHDLRAAQGSIRIDVDETDEAFRIAADVPGFEKEDISLKLDGQVLTITASRSARGEAKRDDAEEAKMAGADDADEDDEEEGVIVDASDEEEEETKEEAKDGADGADGASDGPLAAAAGAAQEVAAPQQRSHVRERAWFRRDQVSRSIRLPKSVDTDGASADYRNGVLTVSIPKRSGATRIAIN